MQQAVKKNSAENQLPPETHVGAFTFGCKVDGKIYTEIDINGNGRPYSTIFDSLRTSLLPLRIPYGTLYDRVYEWSGLSDWKNGDNTSIIHLFQSWYDAEQSVVNPLSRPNNYAAMRSAVQQQLFTIKLPIIALNFQFAYFDSTCVQDGRVSA